MYPLGRKEAVDENDKKFPMELVIPQKVTIMSKYWYAYSVHLNQTGDTCVANAWTHFLTDSPRTHKLYDLDSNRPKWRTDGGFNYYISAQSDEVGFRGYLYDGAQSIDEFDDTPPQGGTSVRAGAKVLQSIGAISTYHWANNVGDIANAILTVGPVVMGTVWLNSMFNPTVIVDKWYLKVDTSSGVAGGHAWVVNGYNSETGEFRMKNSWGKDWGNGGHAYIRSADMEYLLNDGGECCIGLEP